MSDRRGLAMHLICDLTPRLVDHPLSINGEGKVTPAVRAFYAWRGGMDICLRQM